MWVCTSSTVRLGACCIIQMALKACQLNYRVFTRNIMSCPTISGVTFQLGSRENLAPWIQLKKMMASVALLKFQPNCFGCQVRLLLRLSFVVIFYCRLYVIGSAFMFPLTFKTSKTHHGFPFGGCRITLSPFKICIGHL